MKKLLLVSCVVLGAATARADELADAAKLQQNKDYAGAIALYTRLAQAGNVEAQLQLGDMYGFGEGAPENPAEATKWLKLAAASGNKDATANLQALQERAVRKQEIAFYADQYQGADVDLRALGCVAPEIPALSQTKAQIVKVDADVKAWFDCYNRFTEQLNRALPPGKMIPANVVGVMSNPELTRARMRMDAAYARISAEAQKTAADIGQRHDGWRAKTEEELRRQATNDLRILDRERGSARTNVGENDPRRK